MNGLDFVTDLWALVGLDADHYAYGVTAMLVAIGVNFAAALLGFFRTAWAEQLLDAKIVKAHMWEHTVLTIICITNLDSLNLLAWKHVKILRNNTFSDRPVLIPECSAIL